MGKLALFLAGCVAGSLGTLVVKDVNSEDSKIRKIPQKWEKLNTVLEDKKEEVKAEMVEEVDYDDELSNGEIVEKNN